MDIVYNRSLTYTNMTEVLLGLYMLTSRVQSIHGTFYVIELKKSKDGAPAGCRGGMSDLTWPANTVWSYAKSTVLHKSDCKHASIRD
jgi:hypothetical protein